MTYTSYGFALLLACGLLLYYILPGTCRKAVLFCISLLFLLLAGGVQSLFFLTLSAGVSFSAALLLEKCAQGRPNGANAEESSKAGCRSSAGTKMHAGAGDTGAVHTASPKRSRKLIYGAAVLIQLSMLIVFKYLNFPAYTRLALSELSGGTYEFEAVSILAPLGISFYALMQLSYLTEVYRGSEKASRSVFDYGLYSGFFLHIVQGPIDRFAKLSGQFSALSERVSFQKLFTERFLNGFTRLFWGLFKKLVLSERLAVFVNTIYGDTEMYGGSFLVFAAVCYALQLYTDFSGCMDMLLGIGELFGIRLSENFKQPFFSRSDAEFWRRWHITLGNWFKDYLMYPLLRTRAFTALGKWGRRTFGKRQGKKIPVCLSLLIVWFLLGLWHGGMWTFIIGSGLWHCALMISAQLFEPLTKRFYKVTGLSEENRVWRGVQMLRTFLFVSIGFVFFRSDSLTMAFDIFYGMTRADMGLFTDEGFLSLGMSVPDAAVLLLGLMLLFLVSRKLEKSENVCSVGDAEAAVWENASFAERVAPDETVRLLFFSGLLLSVLILGFYGQGYDAADFIYSKF